MNQTILGSSPANSRIVTCDGYCEEIEIPAAKKLPLPEDLATRDAQIRHDIESVPWWGVHSDSDIAESIISVLYWNVTTRWCNIKPVVSHGCVSLTGQVAWEFQKHVAEYSVSELPGVKHIDNEIEVKSLVDKK